MSAAQDRYIKVGEINARYWEAGSQGLDVVLIHGLGGCVEHWLPSFAPRTSLDSFVCTKPGGGRYG